MCKSPYYIYDKISKTELVLYRDSVISYPLHNHSSIFSAGVILDGKISLSKANEYSIYKTNEIFIIPPYVPHALYSKGKCTLLTICINKNEISKLDINCFIKRIVYLYTEMFSLGFLTGENISLLSTKILHCKEMPQPEPLMPEIESMKQILETHPEKSFSIEEMAELSYMSKYYFIRKFKAEIGLTPHQFQMQNKIRKARNFFNILDNTAEIALETGFFDQSHFIRYFKKITGLTPAVYKKAFKTVYI
jgi:AraC-like DNA-binding protein